MNSKYYDVSACMQVIGDVFINPSLLDLEEKYIQFYFAKRKNDKNRISTSLCAAAAFMVRGG